MSDLSTQAIVFSLSLNADEGRRFLTLFQAADWTSIAREFPQFAKDKNEQKMQETKTIEAFSAMMQEELRRNSNKGDFLTGWLPNFYQLSSEVNWHLAKWHHASIELMRDPDSTILRHEVNEYAVDVANYMLKSAYHYGRMQLEQPIPDQH